MTRGYGTLALAGLLLPVASLHGQQPRSFSGATFVAPAGFTLDSKPTVQSYARVRGRDLCMIVVYQEEDSPPGLDASFDNAWGAVFSRGYRRNARPPMREEVSPNGYRHGVGEGDLEDLDGNPFTARLHVFPVGTRTQTVVWLGNSRAALGGCQVEWNAFFGSLRFPRAQVASAPSPPPRDSALGRPDTTRPADRPGRPEPTDAGPGAATRFENITYTPPAGWRVARNAAGVTLSPSTSRWADALVQVTLLPGQPLRGDLPAAFPRVWQEVIGMYGGTMMTEVMGGGNYSLEEVDRTLRGYEYLHGEGGMQRGYEEYLVDLYLFRAGDRMERVVVLSRRLRVNLLTIESKNDPAHARALHTLIFTLSFANQPPIPLSPARVARENSVSGVWAGLGMSFGKIKTQYAILFENGTAFFGPNFPGEGLDGIDPSVAQPSNRRAWGTYTTSGGQGVISVPSGQIPFRVLGAGLELITNNTAHRYIRLHMPSGNQLAGTWCLSEGQCMQLLTGGRFRDNGVVRVLEHPNYSEAPASPAGGDGTYVIKDHTITFRYDRGPEIRIAFPGLDGGPDSNPQLLLLSFNLDELRRR